MSVNLLIKPQPGSSAFLKRTIIVEPGGRVAVSRGSKDNKPQSDNAVFDCRVMSKYQALISSDGEGRLFLSDCGSSNGTFINNLRLSKPNKTSKEVQLYSQDIIRFGSSVVDKDRTVEKCVCGRIEIFDQSGTELSHRPTGSKYCLESANTEKQREVNGKKTVSFFAGDTGSPGHDNQKFKINGRTQDDNLNNQSEEFYLREIDNLTQQLLGKSDEIENLKNQLVAAEERKFCSDLELQKELDFRSSGEEIRKKDKKGLESYDCHYLQLEGQVNSLQSNLQVKAEQIEQINSLLTQAEDVLIEKEQEISWLNESIFQMEQSLKEKDEEFVSLKSLMTEENETVHQIEVEMQKLLQIISDDKQLIQEKDVVIRKLRKQNLQIDQMDFKKILQEKDIAMKHLQSEKEDELLDVNKKLELYENSLTESEREIESLRNNLKTQLELSETHKVLQSKMSELMKIIEEQNIQIKNLNEKEKNQHTISQRNEILQKELHVLKITIQQKDLDIKSLNQLLDGKEERLKETENTLSKLNIEADLRERDETIKALEKRICSEQESHKETEDELIKLKINLDTLKTEKSSLSGESGTGKDEMIVKLHHDLLREQQVAAEVQFLQEKEIIDKAGLEEKEIANLKEQISKYYLEENLQKGSADVTEDEETVTFHDALSDTSDDILLDDLEYD